MKKFFAMLVAAIVLTISGISNASAQGCAFSDGSLGLNFGFGCGNSNSYNGYHYDGFFVPTFDFALDYAFLGNIINSHGSISGGLYFGIGRGSEKNSGDKFTDGRWRIGTRGALHYTWVSNLDTYAGVAFGYRNDTYKWNGGGKTTDPRFDCYGFAGARYDFGGVAVYSELATTNFAFFQIGLSFIL